MSNKPIVIVESPTKAKTIQKFLPEGFKVIASNGHIRDLPNNASEVPEKYKKEKWATLGIDVENNFTPLYVIPANKKNYIKQLKEVIKKSDLIYLATDEDREGESISWHILEALKPKIPHKRLVFHEITKQAIVESLKRARDIDEDLVKAQETRRLIDRLYGYTVSPLLWKKLSKGLSAGRVQSVAIRLLVEKEKARVRFCKASYWTMNGIFEKDRLTSLETELVTLENKRIVIGKDFDPSTGKLKKSIKDKVVLLDEGRAKKIADEISKENALVSSVEEKPYSTKPGPPFVTSTLQQEANRKHRYSARRTMSVAQQLYENGFITYMRTDSTILSQQAIDAARTLIEKNYGPEYLPVNPRIYKTKVKNAQEAHEAIRPAGESFIQPRVVLEKLGQDAFKLYSMIWKRTIACQMKDTKGKRVAIMIKAGEAVFRASGKTIEFPGFLKAWFAGVENPDEELAEKEKILPKLKEGEQLKVSKITPFGRETQPSARYTEGSLIKELESRSIGRPSTWATVVETIMNRSYAFRKGSALIPTFTAIAVIGLMEKHFDKIVDYDFTAKLEDDLDAISRGEISSLEYLSSFFLGNGHQGLRELVSSGEENIQARDVSGIPIFPKTEEEKDYEGKFEVRIGRYGAFLSDGETRVNLHHEVVPEEMTITKAKEMIEQAAKGPSALGYHPETKRPIYVKTGRYGPYVQLGEQEEKPKMVSLLPGMTVEDVTLEIAQELLKLPKTLGQDPQNGKDVIAANGRYGPYIKSGTETRSLPSDAPSLIEVDLNYALELLKQPKGRRTASSIIIAELGQDNERKITIKKGRYGPYATDGVINASIPKDQKPEEITLEQALDLIAERKARKGKS